METRTFAETLGTPEPSWARSAKNELNQYTRIEEDGATYMMHERHLIMGDLFKDAHDKLQLIFRHRNRLRYIRLLALALRSAPHRVRTRPCASSRQRAKRARSLSPSLLVVLHKPIPVAFIHIIREPLRKGTRKTLLRRLRRLDIRRRVDPGVYRLIVFHHARRVWCRNIRGLVVCLFPTLGRAAAGLAMPTL